MDTTNLPNITPAFISRLCEHIINHNSVQTACRMEGITDAQYSMVMVMAEEDPDSMAGRLKAEIDRAEAQAESEAVKALVLLVHQGHAGAIMWLAERRYSAQWAKSDGKAKDTGATSGAAPQIMLPPNGRETKL